MSPEAREIASHHYTVRSTITKEQWAVIDREASAKHIGSFGPATTDRRLDRIFEAEAERARANTPESA